jgi:hypothetical protein
LLETLAELRDATARAIPELGGEARNGASLLAAIDVASAAFTDASEPV